MALASQGITSSVVVCGALGWKPDGVPAKAAGRCALCGYVICKGDLQAPLALGSAFVDDLSLAARGSPVICGFCAQLLTADALRKTGYGVFSLAGFARFLKWGHIRKALLAPPEPPFVMVYATANNQHMAWRAPVNWSREDFTVRVGLQDLRVRLPRVLEAVEAAAVVAEGLGLKRSPTAKLKPHPFLGLTSDLKDPTHGVFRREAVSDRKDAEGRRLTARSCAEIAETDPVFRAAYEKVLGLGLGETWALNFILWTGPDPDDGGESRDLNQQEESDR